jgi:hypothetical protein
MVIQVLIWVGLGLLGGYIAAHKGYPPTWGVVIGVFIGPIGLVVAALMPRTARGREQAMLERQTRMELSESSKTQACPQCRRQNSVTTRVCPRCEYRFP